MMMMLMMMIIIINNWLWVWRIRLQVTNNLTAPSYSQASSFIKQSVDLILILPLGHERYAVLSDIINK